MSDAHAGHIRNRKSYKLFAKEAKFFSKPRTLAQILRHIYELLDKGQAWGSQMHSAWAEESLRLAIKDLAADIIDIGFIS